jgi:hypothetical protein
MASPIGDRTEVPTQTGPAFGDPHRAPDRGRHELVRFGFAGGGEARPPSPKLAEAV